MERDFHHYLLKLDHNDRNDSLLTFLHLLDDDELAHLLQMSRDEQASRGKRAAGCSSGKRPESARNQSTAGRDLFKRVRLSVDTSTPVRAAPSPVTSNSLRRVTRLPAAVTKPKDLLSGLVRGQQPVATNHQSDPAEKMVTDAPAGGDDEEEKWDDEFDAIIAAYDADGQDRESDVTAASNGKQTDEASGDSDPIPDYANGSFVTGKYKKKTVTRNGREALLNESDDSVTMPQV